MRDAPASPARFLRLSYLIAALIPLLIIALSVTGFAWAQKGVTLVVDGETRYIKTHADSVGALLAHSEIELGDADVVAPSLDDPVTDGMTIVVRHAVPVTLRFPDEAIKLDVVGATVADALVAAGLDAGYGLSVTPPLESPLTPEMVIEATDVFVRVVEEEVEVPYEVVMENDPTLSQGSRAIKRHGEPGVTVRMYRVLVTAGVEGARTLTAERVVTEPVDEVVLVGTKRSSQRVAARARAASSEPPRDGKQLTVTATGYSSGDPGVTDRTATGARATYGVIAVDPSVIPLGTRVYIPGYGNAVAADTGGAIRGNKIDLCFDSRTEALAWGRRTVTITILP